MSLITPMRQSSQRLPAASCFAIERASGEICDPEVTAWLQRHFAAATSDGPILRPYARDAIATFRDGLLHSTGDGLALILADGRGWRASRGELWDPVTGVDFRAARRRLQRPDVGRIAYWVASSAVVLALAARSFWM